MKVCLLVYAAFQYRRRTVLKPNEATFPDPKGQQSQSPTARFVGIHVHGNPGKPSLLLNLTEAYHNVLQLLGHRYTRFYR